MIQSDKNRPLSRSVVVGLTAVADLFSILVSACIVYTIYLPESEKDFSRYAGTVIIYAAIVLLSFKTIELYRFVRIIEPRQQILRILSVCTFSFFALSAIAFSLKISASYSRVWAFSWLLLLIPSLCAGRFLIAARIREWARSGRFTRNIIVYGAGEQGENLLQYLETLNEPWNNIVGVFDERLNRVQKSIQGIPVLGNLDDLVSYARKYRGDEILIALPWKSHDRIHQVVHRLLSLPINIRLSPEILSTAFSGNRISDRFGVPMLSVAEKPVSGWGTVKKSIIDSVLGGLFLALSLPIMLVIALAIKLESPGPVFFRQKRYGFNNNLMNVLKFRTMYVDQNDYDAEKLTEQDDPRVTKVGRVLRRFSLDELPQFINVLKGEMSIVGPRPHAMKAKADGRLYDEVVGDYAVRHKVKPGITGWAQVNGWRGATDSEKDITRRVEHDIYYIEHWSALFDIYIVFRTVATVLAGENSY